MRRTGLRLLRLAAGAEQGGVTWQLGAPRRETVLRGTSRYFQGPGPRRPSDPTGADSLPSQQGQDLAQV